MAVSVALRSRPWSPWRRACCRSCPQRLFREVSLSFSLSRTNSKPDKWETSRQRRGLGPAPSGTLLLCPGGQTHCRHSTRVFTAAPPRGINYPFQPSRSSAQFEGTALLICSWGAAERKLYGRSVTMRRHAHLLGQPRHLSRELGTHIGFRGGGRQPPSRPVSLRAEWTRQGYHLARTSATELSPRPVAYTAGRTSPLGRGLLSIWLRQVVETDNSSIQTSHVSPLRWSAFSEIPFFTSRVSLCVPRRGEFKADTEEVSDVQD